MALGQDLRTARLNRRLTLSQVAERTRIKIKMVEAIENEDFSSVPAPIYAKGFIRLYAECVGLDPHQLIDEYITRFGQSSVHHLERDMFTIDRRGTVTRREGVVTPVEAAADVSAIVQPATPVASSAPVTPHPAAHVHEEKAPEPISEQASTSGRLIQPDLFLDTPPVAEPTPIAPAPKPSPVPEPIIAPIIETLPEPIAEPEPVQMPREADDRMESHNAAHARPANALWASASPTEEPIPEEIPRAKLLWPVKALFVGLAAVLLVMLAISGLHRMVGSRTPKPSPEAPPPTAALRIAVDPPAPYFD